MATTYWVFRGHYPGYSGPGLYWLVDDGVGDYRVFQENQYKQPWRTLPRTPAPASIRAALTANGAQLADLVEATYRPGEYHPRMWRPHAGPRQRDLYEPEFRSAQGAALNLALEMQNVFRYVEPSGNRAAYGHEIRQLLILACTEVEAQCKAVLRANHYTRLKKNKTPVAEKDWKITDYFKVARPLRLAGFKLRTRGHPRFPVLDPFDAWGAGTFAGLSWYSAYNQVKHDREQQFHLATLDNMVAAMAAVYVLITAQFGHFGNHYSFGYSEIDAFDLAQARPEFDLAEQYVPPELAGLASWQAVDYCF